LPQVQSNFYFPVQYCTDTVCNTQELVWVTDFQSVPALKVLTVLAQPFGVFSPGLYVRLVSGYWKLAMTYEDMCASIVTASSVKVVMYATSVQSFPTGTLLFREAVEQSGSVLTPSPAHPGDVWVVITSTVVEAINSGIIGSDKNFAQNFTNQNTVVVTHNLDKMVSTTVIDPFGQEVECNVIINSVNQVTVSFTLPFSGTVICN
jgi:hypothetical protein